MITLPVQKTRRVVLPVTNKRNWRNFENRLSWERRILCGCVWGDFPVLARDVGLVSILTRHFRGRTTRDIVKTSGGLPPSTCEKCRQRGQRRSKRWQAGQTESRPTMGSGIMAFWGLIQPAVASGNQLQYQGNAIPVRTCRFSLLRINSHFSSVLTSAPVCRR